MSKSEQKLFTIISGILGVDYSSITDETSTENTAEWDSFNTVTLIAEIEKEYNLRFQMDEMVTVKSVKSVKDLLKSHNIDIAQ